MQDDRFRSDLGLQNDEPISANMFSRHVTEIDSGFSSFTSTLPPELVKAYKDAALEGPRPDQISFGPLFLISGMAFTALHATSGAFVCGDVSTHYQWGYAYLIFLLFGLFHRQRLLFFFLSPTCVCPTFTDSVRTHVVAWVLGTYITWIHTTRPSKSQLNRCGRTPGPYRAILDLGEAIKLELGDETGGYEDDEWRRFFLVGIR